MSGSASFGSPRREPDPKIRAQTAKNSKKARKALTPARAAPEERPAARGGVVVKPVVNAVRILQFLSQTGKPARAVQISRHLSLNSSTCFNILRTLTMEQILEFDPLSKTYSAGLGLVKLVETTLSEGQRVAVARPMMHDLAARFGITVSLWRRLGADRIVLVAIEHSPQDLRIHLTEGQRLPFLMGASGRLMACHLGMKKAQLRTEFKALRWQTPLSFDDYVAEVEQARERGFAVDNGNFTRGVLTVAAPVFDANGAIAFTLSGVMFQGQCDEAGVAAIGKAFVDLTPRLSKLLF